MDIARRAEKCKPRLTFADPISNSPTCRASSLPAKASGVNVGSVYRGGTAPATPTAFPESSTAAETAGPSSVISAKSFLVVARSTNAQTPRARGLEAFQRGSGPEGVRRV